VTIYSREADVLKKVAGLGLARESQYQCYTGRKGHDDCRWTAVQCEPTSQRPTTSSWQCLSRPLNRSASRRFTLRSTFAFADRPPLFSCQTGLLFFICGSVEMPTLLQHSNPPAMTLSSVSETAGSAVAVHPCTYKLRHRRSFPLLPCRFT
jgi:hypothetical protein